MAHNLQSPSGPGLSRRRVSHQAHVQAPGPQQHVAPHGVGRQRGLVQVQRCERSRAVQPRSTVQLQARGGRGPGGRGGARHRADHPALQPHQRQRLAGQGGREWGLHDARQTTLHGRGDGWQTATALGAPDPAQAGGWHTGGRGCRGGLRHRTCYRHSPRQLARATPHACPPTSASAPGSCAPGRRRQRAASAPAPGSAGRIPCRPPPPRRPTSDPRPLGSAHVGNGKGGC